jgi:hypothetical protein
VDNIPAKICNGMAMSKFEEKTTIISRVHILHVYLGNKWLFVISDDPLVIDYLGLGLSNCVVLMYYAGM